jgi:hypothetical protein
VPNGEGALLSVDALDLRIFLGEKFKSELVFLGSTIAKAMSRNVLSKLRLKSCLFFELTPIVAGNERGRFAE